MGSIGLGLALALAPLVSTSRAEAQPTGDAPKENWATARARALTEQGTAHREKGATDAAVSRFNEAISIDTTFEPAYLALASLREAAGEWKEALAVLDMGLERVPGSDELLSARAALLARAKQFASATAAYLHVLERHDDDEAALRQLLVVAPRANLLPVALGAARRLMFLCKARGDDACAKDARLTTRALEKMIAEADPVTRGSRARDPVRRALSRSSTR